MTLAPPTNEPRVVLKPYTPAPNSPGSRRARRLVWWSLPLFCLLEGFVFALLAPNLLMMFLVPFAIMAVFIIWALPETGLAPERTLTTVFFTFVATVGLWPNYLALTLPGLPWITVARLTGIPLVVIFSICLSVSKRFRDDLATPMNGEPLIWKGVVAFSAIQLISIAFSKDKGSSLDRFFMAQLSWAAMMFIAAYIFMRPGFVRRWIAVLWATLIPIGLIGVWENHLQHVPWLGHVPSFLKINDPNITQMLMGTSRAGSGVYRVQSTFTTSITLSEYIVLIIPFVIYHIVGSYRVKVKIVAWITVVFMAYVIFLTNSRSGVIGSIISVMLCVLYWGAVKWRSDKQNIIGPAIVFSYPMTGAAVLAATFVVGRLHRLVWGGGQYANSTAARSTQLHIGIPKLLSHPWGYGIGQGAQTLGYFTPGGRLTIDTYYLDIALEYGIIGFIVFYGLFAFSIYKGAKYSLLISDSTSEESFLAPAVIALMNFFIIKAVFSQQDNNPIVFMLLGMVLALITRIRRAQGVRLATSPAARAKRHIVASKPIVI